MIREPVKLVISYDMKPGREEACQRYVVTQLAETLNEFGFQFTDAWYTVWGNGPQMMGCGLLDDIDAARKLLQSPDWQRVVDGLRPFANNFRARVIKPAAAFQI